MLLSLVEPPEGVPGVKAFAKRITDPGRETGGDMRVTRVDDCVRPSRRIGHIARVGQRGVPDRRAQMVSGGADG
ncbi:MAG TPA: hypothetical protein VKE74_04960 [Gemmataceae bacterium]|nr:hypothetical protein [Gemmataceae bacterium]